MEQKKRVSLAQLADMKANGKRIVALTAYDYLTAALLDDMGVDLILVGDSLGMVFCGYETTLPVTLEQMEYHTEIVGRAAKHLHRKTSLPPRRTHF